MHAPVATTKADPWILECDDKATTVPAYLTNGFLGVRIKRDGTGAVPGFLLPGAYNSHQNIIDLPNPLQQKWSAFDLATADKYSQTLNMKSGVLTTSWTQPNLTVKCQQVCSPTRAVIAQRWDIESSERATLECDETQPGLHTELDIAGTTPFIQAYRVQLLGGIENGLTEVRLPNGHDFGCADLHIRGIAPPHHQLTFEQVWDFSPGATWQTMPNTFETVRDQSNSAWAKRWQTDIVIDGPVEDQEAIHSWLFYLRASASAEKWPDFNPLGLSSNLYKGHIFWDADAWMFPALCFTDPKAASVIPNYRLKNGYYNKTGVVFFPWESAETFEELAPRALQNEQHITGDVAFMLNQASELGLASKYPVASVLAGASRYYQGIASNGGKMLHIRQVKGPDEYHVGDDDLYTNALAQWLSDITNSKLRYFLPHDSQSLLTYDNDPVRNYQQADAVLAIYPVQNKTAEEQEAIMMERFPPKTNKFGPAMTDSVQALILARAGSNEPAYEEWEKSWKDFLNPLGLFGEIRGKDRTYFQTGAAGCLQTVLYGFLGFRIDLQNDVHAPWRHRLNGKEWLTIQPHLPKEWNRVTFKNFSLLGKRYTLTATQSGITMTQGEP
ncbi:MAG TPA: glycosyl hydrolase family 65 protein [Fimbriimonadaceae bacterium]